ncbi:hypothetical protein B5F12_03520 [Pseudoflavonifractor sp. An176]|uniref:nucleoside 2-deoxyribosyltransferase n=1 Tax=Pseudoflavonifractor sp. An176 TaxID=1965572 RepID=UPI000B36980D|nr:nucleoside 2-deoxyribosyltransferase [Pseudoflavonifractor sp. An176]OUP65075.1 hypothetical protein B5F12_03520 [Pseudoflavonifractor sp. An176]
MINKSRVFVITPFDEDYLALYEELKTRFEEDFYFTNAGDLDNQQNILQDIVEGIYQADVIIADLTGLNPNVFYELGLAHAMNKKVIIITQDLAELPFDIKSYRANEYSLQFNKLPKLIEELKKLLYGAIDGSIKYGNPVSDYIPGFYKSEEMITDHSNLKTNVDENSSDINDVSEDYEEDGFLDHIANIEENSQKMTDEITAMGIEMNDMNSSINAASNEIQRVKDKSGNINASFARNICRKLSEPVDIFAGKLKNHVSNVTGYWNIVENSYLSLLDNQYAKKQDNSEKLRASIDALGGLQSSMYDTDTKIENFIDVLRGSMGMERRLNRAITMLASELEKYLLMTETIASSIDRIVSKGEVILEAVDKM